MSDKESNDTEQYEYERKKFKPNESVEIPESAIGVTLDFQSGAFYDEIIVRYLVPETNHGVDNDE